MLLPLNQSIEVAGKQRSTQACDDQHLLLKDSNVAICLQPDLPIQAWKLDHFEYTKFEFSPWMQKNRWYH